MNLSINDSYKNRLHNYSEPLHDIDPRLKDTAEWHLNYMQYAYCLWANDRTAITSALREKILYLRDYAEGNQDPGIYEKILLNPGEEGPVVPEESTSTVNPPLQQLNSIKKGWWNVNFKEVFSPAPKYMNRVIGMFESIDHEIVVRATDERSGMERLNMKEESWFYNVYGEFAKSFEEKYGFPEFNDLPPLVPSTREELEMFYNMGVFKLRYEVAMSKLLAHTEDISEMNKLKRKIIRDMATLNMAAATDYLDPLDRKVKFKYQDPMYLIMEYSNDYYHQNSRFAGYFTHYTIIDLRQEMPDVSEAKLYELASTYKGQFGNITQLNSIQNPNGGYNYDNCLIPVMCLQWKSFKRQFWRNVEKRGTKYTYRAEFGKVINNDYKNTFYTDTRTKHEGKWVVGTDIVFGWGEVPGSAFDYENKDVRISTHLVKIPGKSFIERAIPAFDQCQLTFLRLQNETATAPPNNGIAININSLQNISYQEGSTLTPPDLISLRTATGMLLYAADIDEGMKGGSGNATRPFQELKGGVKEAVTDAMMSFELQFNLISELIGIDRISAVSKQPGAEAAVGTTKIATASSIDTIKSVYSAYIDLKGDLAKNAALTIQMAIQANTDKEIGYSNVIGITGLQAIKDAGTMPPTLMGIDIQPKPTEEEKQDIKQAAVAAMQVGKSGVPGITYGQYLFIVNELTKHGGIDNSRAYLHYLESKRMIRDQQIAERNMQLQSQSMAQLEQQKTQKELEKAQMEHEFKVKEIQVKEEEVRKTETLKHTLKMEELKLQNSFSEVGIEESE